MVLEVVPAELAGLITERLTIPTIGIGAGPRCDGQVQVLNDMLGLYTDVQPKHVKRYAGLADVAQSALAGYAEEVRSGAFPTKEHSFSMVKAALKVLSETALGATSRLVLALPALPSKSCARSIINSVMFEDRFKPSYRGSAGIKSDAFHDVRSGVCSGNLRS